jgi:tetratricopeptide (TPR) repeat protein
VGATPRSYDLSEHEGKEIAVPIKSVFQILNNLGSKVPHVFNEENLIQTQVIKYYLGHSRDEKSDSKEISDSKNVDREKSTEYCNDGIEAKRNGNYEEAIDYYKKAINSDYSNPASYMNSAKVLIGIGKYNEAIRNILTYIHLKLPKIDESQFNDVNLFYELEKSNKISHNHRKVRKLFKKQPLIKQIAVDVNATFNAVSSYIMINSDGLKIPNNIPDELIDNEQNILLGQKPNGVNLRQTHFANMVHVIGAMFLYSNLNNVLKNKYDISKYYLNNANDLNDI